MRLKDYIRLGWDQLRRRKVVTALCVMGIAIGCSAIIVALAFGESANYYAQKQMSYYLKTDEITVHLRQNSGAQQDQDRVLRNQIEMIRSFPHVKSVATYQSFYGFMMTADGNKQKGIELVATDLTTLHDFGMEFQQGAELDMDNTIILNYGATIGLSDPDSNRRAQLQRQQDPGNQELEEALRQQRLIPYPLYQKQVILSYYIVKDGRVAQELRFPVRVVGILKKPEGLPEFMLNSLNQGYISTGLAQQISEAIKEAGDPMGSMRSDISSMKVKVDDTANVAETEKLIQKLRLNTTSNLHQQERMQGEFTIIRIVLGGVGTFILFVASISIVVAMTMSTYQRRRQIGIMKVLGANLRQIRNMFIIESALLGLLGGAVGVLASYWVVWSINIVLGKFASQSPGAEEELLFISYWIIALGMFFAVMTGVLSGLYPAVKAARTDALTAIKRE